MASKKEAELKPVLLRIANSDKSTLVKAAAITFLAENYSGADLGELFKRSSAEQSYAVLSASLKGLVKTDPELALQKAKDLESEKNNDIFEALAFVYSKAGQDEKNAYFIKSKDNFSNYGYLTYIYYYNNFLKQSREPRTFVDAASVYSEIISTGNGYVKSETKKAYVESILNVVKTKEEESKKSAGTSEKSKEWEAARIKIEELYKTT